MRKNNAKIKKTIYSCFKVLIYIVIFLILLYILINGTKTLKLNEYEAFIVISESMEPKINRGDILIIKQVKENEIEKGDIITFERNDEYVTHRVVEITEEKQEKKYITKGDNNLVTDKDEVFFENIKGVKILRIPILGWLIIEISAQKYIIIFLLILIILYKRAKNIDDKKMERRKKKKIEDGKNIND